MGQIGSVRFSIWLFRPNYGFKTRPLICSDVRIYNYHNSRVCTSLFILFQRPFGYAPGMIASYELRSH
jgi:hypothetical protein